MFKKDRPAAYPAFLSAALVSVPALPLIWFTTRRSASYGWLLFVGLPFALGFVSTLIHNRRVRHSPGSCLRVSTLSVLMVGSLMLLAGMEGLICLTMALVIALPLASLGAMIAFSLSDLRSGRVVAGCLALVFPLYAPQEPHWHHEPAHFAVRSSVEIAAPPSVVWNHVIAFSEIPAKPDSPILRTGIAYPIRATITGRGVGAVRQCWFTTGAFVEPIDVWDEPRRLHFGVAKQPPVMNELSFFPDLKPEHITREYLRSRQGQFLLTTLPNGHTRLEGTTWYDLQYWPASYWRLWSDAIIHRIHMRVLNHIKEEVESQEGQLPTSAR